MTNNELKKKKNIYLRVMFTAKNKNFQWFFDWNFSQWFSDCKQNWNEFAFSFFCLLHKCGWKKINHTHVCIHSFNEQRFFLFKFIHFEDGNPSGCDRFLWMSRDIKFFSVTAFIKKILSHFKDTVMKRDKTWQTLKHFSSFYA